MNFHLHNLYNTKFIWRVNQGNYKYNMWIVGEWINLFSCLTVNIKRQYNYTKKYYVGINRVGVGLSIPQLMYKSDKKRYQSYCYRNNCFWCVVGI